MIQIANKTITPMTIKVMKVEDMEGSENGGFARRQQSKTSGGQREAAVLVRRASRMPESPRAVEVAKGRHDHLRHGGRCRALESCGRAQSCRKRWANRSQPAIDIGLF